MKTFYERYLKKERLLILEEFKPLNLKFDPQSNTQSQAMMEEVCKKNGADLNYRINSELFKYLAHTDLKILKLSNLNVEYFLNKILYIDAGTFQKFNIGLDDVTQEIEVDSYYVKFYRFNDDLQILIVSNEVGGQYAGHFGLGIDYFFKDDDDTDLDLTDILNPKNYAHDINDLACSVIKKIIFNVLVYLSTGNPDLRLERGVKIPLAKTKKAELKRELDALPMPKGRGFLGLKQQ